MAFVFAAMVGSAHAACTNASNFDTTLFPNQTSSADGFSVGDQLTITATYNSGPDSTTAYAELSAGGSLVASITGNFPVVVVYTVTAPFGPSTLFQIENTHPTNANAIDISVTCIAGQTSQSYDRAVTKGFLLSRINGLLLNSPGAMSLLNRHNSTVQPQQMASAAGSANGVAAFGSAMGLGAGLGNRADGISTDRLPIGNSRFGDEDANMAGGNNLHFSGSLSQMRRLTAAQMERMSLGAGDGGALPVAYEISSPWDIWVEGRYSGFSDDAGSIDRDGHVGLLYVGGDYRVAENMIVGVLAQFDWAKDDSGVLASKVDGNGWMIGPYMSAQIHQNIYFDLRAAWGRSDNDLTIGTTTGAFDTSRWLVKGTLAGNWVHDTWRVTPTAEIAYVTESQDAFTNSAGTFVPGQDVSLGRLQFGPEVGYRIQHTAGTFIEPFAAIKGVWDWDNPNVAIIDGFVVGPGDFWGRLEGGLNVMTADGWLVRGMASWDGVASDDYNGYTLQGIVNVPLN